MDLISTEIYNDVSTNYYYQFKHCLFCYFSGWLKQHPFTMNIILQKTNSNEQFLTLHYLYLLMVTLCWNAYCGKLCCYSMCHSHDSVDCFHVYILVSKARTSLCILCLNSEQFKLFIDNIGHHLTFYNLLY